MNVFVPLDRVGELFLPSSRVITGTEASEKLQQIAEWLGASNRVDHLDTGVIQQWSSDGTFAQVLEPVFKKGHAPGWRWRGYMLPIPVRSLRV